MIYNNLYAINHKIQTIFGQKITKFRQLSPQHIKISIQQFLSPNISAHPLVAHIVFD